LASELAEKALKEEPDNTSLLTLSVETFSECERIDEMVARWKKLEELDQEKALDPFLLEAMAWGVIRKGSRDSALPLRLLSLLAAALSKDFRGVHLVEEAMDHPNSMIRSVAYQVSGQMGDDCLKDKIIKRLAEEKESEARLSLIRSLGTLRIKEKEPFLIQVVENSSSRQEERESAFEALLALHERPKRREVEELLKSPRSLHRAVGSRLALHLNPAPPLSLFLPLLEDPSRRVILEAARTIGLLYAHDPKLPDIIQGLKKRPEGEARVASLWMATLRNAATPEDWLPFLNHPNLKVSLYSAALLNTAGEKSLPIRKALLEKTTEPFVQLNLSLGLLNDVEDQNKLLSLLSSLFDKAQPLWNVGEQGGVSYIAPQRGEALPALVTTKDLDTVARLEFLNEIAPFAPAFAEEKLKGFLTHRRPEIGLLATSLLIKEGSEEMLQQVEELLEDPSFPHRVEAALLLSLWRRDDEGVQILQEHYPQGDRHEKEILLQGIARLGSPKQAPFLIGCFKEPFPMLRVFAAFALVGCLNN
jgi:HEAT repeat protein